MSVSVHWNVWAASNFGDRGNTVLDHIANVPAADEAMTAAANSVDHIMATGVVEAVERAKRVAQRDRA